MDIVTLQETWLTPDIETNEFLHNTNFEAFRKDRIEFNNEKKKGGGVLTLVSRSIQSEEIPLTEFSVAEIQATLVKNSEHEIAIVNCYLPPNGNRVNMLNELEELIKKIRTKHVSADLIVIGDFNFSRLRWRYREPNVDFLVPKEMTYTNIEEYLIKISNEQTLQQVNQIANSRNKYLDLVFSSDFVNTSCEKPTDVDIFDKASIHHTPIIVRTTFHCDTPEEETKLNFFNVNSTGFKEDLEKTVFEIENLSNEEIFNSVHWSPNDANKVLMSTTDKLFNIQIANTKLTKKPKLLNAPSHPWTANRGLTALFKTKRFLTRLMKTVPTNETRTALATASKAYFIKYNELKNSYYRELVDDARGEAKLLFRFMKEKKSSKSTLPLIMNYKGESVTGPKRYELLREHLLNAFSPDPPPFSDNPDKFDEQMNDFHRAHYSTANERLWEDYDPSFSLHDIAQAINELQERKDFGPMKINTKIIKDNSERLAPIIHSTLNVALSNGTIPSEWKTSYLTPIPKKGAQNNIENYRGIALQSVIPKILDKVLTRKMERHLAEIIPTSQHGFMRGKSTQTNLIEITSFINRMHREKTQVDVVYIDFSKAFDRINHSKMLAKFAELSMPLSFFKLVANFVCNRTYQLRCDGRVLDGKFTASSSVPQGSHVGPLIFIIVCADIISCIDGTGAHILSYADDSKLYKSITNRNDARGLQRALDNLSRWSEENCMQLNSAKTYHVSYYKDNTVHENTFYFIGNVEIERKEQIRDLGVTFDRKMTFDAHITSITNRSKALNAASYRFCREIRERGLRMKIYSTYIQPIIEYCPLIWMKRTKVFEKAISRIQKSTTKAALGIPYSYRSTGYINQNQRLLRLGLISASERLITASIIYLVKTAQGVIRFNESTNIIERVHTNPRNLRSTSHNLFRVEGLVSNDPMTKSIELANSYKHLIDLQRTPNHTRQRLRRAFIEERRALTYG